MEITRQHLNGQILEAFKTYEELTDEEKSALRLSAGSKIENCATFRVDYNKKGQLTMVRRGESIKEYIDKLNNRTDVVDMFVKVERAIKEENVDADFARGAALKSLGIEVE